MGTVLLLPFYKREQSNRPRVTPVLHGFTSNYAMTIGFKASELTWVVFAFMIPHVVATLFM